MADKINRGQIEEITFKLTEAANELYSQGEYGEAITVLLSIDRLCDSSGLDMPDEAVALNIEINEKFDTNLFAEILPNNVSTQIRNLIRGRS